MLTSLSKPDGQRHRGRWVVTVLLTYGAMCVGLLGFFIIFPDEATQRSQAEMRLNIDPVQSARKQGQYRAKNLTAEVR